ncbi:MAG TPA: beta-ketoacyl-ACP synthase II [Methylomirabilota bacterium]|jgi:3-oxoacyl-[acyl-carrier-protein] synthase II|nr:beta-ketoacyl-ACP synthase II [Methylomirabilota bacterium]
MGADGGKTRVVVTGLGAVTPLGNSVPEYWRAVCEGRSGVGPITRFDAKRLDARIAAEVKGFDPLRVIEKKELKKLDLFIQYALVAGVEAVEDAKIDFSQVDPVRAGALVGSGIGGILSILEWHRVLLEKGPGRISPFFIPSLIVNMASGQLSIRYKLKGPNSSVVTACATGNHAIGDAFRIIQRGDADLMVAGGSEAIIDELPIGGFAQMKALSTRNDDPVRASRPFDAARDGFVPGEGAGVVVLENAEHARRRGARVYAEVVGYGMTADAYHMTAPDPDGDGAVRAMTCALRDGGLRPEDVGYINAHGTSTPYNDKTETLAIKQVFGAHAHRLAVSSTKSMTGHLLGAAGGIEAVVTVLALQQGILPPTINYETPDPDCDLDYVPNVARKAEVETALSNGFGFGGTNATLAFRRWRA